MRIAGIHTAPRERVRGAPDRAVRAEAGRDRAVGPAVVEVAARVTAIVEGRRPDLHVEHIGSTAVPGLPGKGIVDLAAETEPAAIPGIVADMYELGFGPQPGSGPVAADAADARRLVHLDGREYRIHLHVQPVGGDYPIDLRFRDALRADPALAADYARVKGRIVDAADGPLDGVVYQDGKGTWIVETLDRLRIPRPKPSAARRQEVGS